MIGSRRTPFRNNARHIQAEVLEALDIHPILHKQETAFVGRLFDTVRAQSRGLRIGQDKAITIGKGGSKTLLTCASRWLPLGVGDQASLCVHVGTLRWVQRELSMDEARSSFREFHSAAHGPFNHPTPGLG